MSKNREENLNVAQAEAKFPPGADTMVKVGEDQENSYPSGEQFAEVPSKNPSPYKSPDNKLSKRNAKSEIKGWGSDLDHAKRPAYPKERIPARDIGVHWTQPEAQAPTVEILHSTERPGITPVFGTSAPPRGFSGILRKTAFGMSENDIRHWLTLLLADRVDVVEGVLEDLVQGTVPNFYKEMGLGAEFKHAPKKLAKRVAIAGLFVGVPLCIYLYHQRQKRVVPHLHLNQ